MSILIDYTTAYGLAMALDRPKIPTWAMQSFSDIAILFLGRQSLVVPDPDAVERSPNVSLFIEPILRLAISELRNETMEDNAAKKSRDFARSNTSTLRGSFDNVWAQIDERDVWLQWHIEKEWSDHVKRLRAMVGSANVDNVAAVSHVTLERVSDLNAKCAHEAAKALQTNANIDFPKVFDSQELDDLGKMWAADIMLRGLYYRELAKKRRGKYVMHSVRRYVLQSDSPGKVVPNTRGLSTLAAMVGNYVCYAHKDKGLKMRLNEFAATLFKVRTLLPEGWGQDQMTQSGAIDAATAVMKRAGLIPEIRVLRAVEGPLSEVLSKATSLLFVPLILGRHDPVAEAAYEAVIKSPTSRFIHYGVTSFEALDWNMRRLAEPAPGWVLSSDLTYRHAQP